MRLLLQTLDVVVTFMVVLVISRAFQDEGRVNRTRDWIRQESERGIAQIEAYLDRHEHHRTR